MRSGCSVTAVCTVCLVKWSLSFVLEMMSLPRKSRQTGSRREEDFWRGSALSLSLTKLVVSVCEHRPGIQGFTTHTHSTIHARRYQPCDSAGATHTRPYSADCSNAARTVCVYVLCINTAAGPLCHFAHSQKKDWLLSTFSFDLSL